MITVIFSHPKHNGINGRIYQAIVEHCKKSAIACTSIDLYAEKFSPLLTEEELDGFYNGMAIDPVVKKYQNILMKTDSLILVFGSSGFFGDGLIPDAV